MFRLFLVITLTVGMFPVAASAYNNFDKKLSASVGATRQAFNGFMQTPDGGQPRTSSRHQPTFDFLDMNDGTAYQADINYRVFPSLIVHADMRMIDIKSKFTSDRNFISKGIKFYQGQNLTSQFKLHRYNIGVLYDWKVTDKLAISVGPAVGIMGFTLNIDDFELKENADRSYKKTSVGLLTGMTYRFDKSTSLNYSFLYTDDFGNRNPKFIDNKLTLRHMFSWVGLDFFVANNHTHYKDSQVFPNHLKMDTLDYGVNLVFQY